MKTLVALPAYNRSYPATNAGSDKCADDWEAGLDFKIFNGPYFSIRDIKTLKNEGYGLIKVFQPSGGLLITVTL